MYAKIFAGLDMMLKIRDVLGEASRVSEVLVGCFDVEQCW